MKQGHKRFYSDVISSLQSNSLSIFAGAGLSMRAGFVDWKGLLNDIAVDLGVNISDENDLVLLAQKCVDIVGGRGMINQRISNVFNTATTITENHKILARLNIGTFWTTNFDNLIEESLKKVNRLPDVKHETTQLTIFIPGRDTVVYKMNGDMSMPNDTILVKKDFDDYLLKRGAFIDVLCADLMQKMFIFIGLSFTDPNLLYALDKIKEKVGGAQRYHWHFVTRVNENEADFKSKQEKKLAFVENLKNNYSLLPVWIDDYSEITSVLSEVELQLIVKEKKDISALFINSNEYEFALHSLIKKYPYNTDLLDSSFHYYYNFKDYNNARNCLERHIEIEPDNVLKLTQLGAVLHNDFFAYKEAEKLFKRAILNNENFELALVNLGNNDLKLSKYQDAKYHYEQAIRININNADAYAGLGRTFIYIQNYEEAKICLNTAISLNPNDSVSFYNLGVLYTKFFKNTELAKGYYTKALDLDPDMIDAHLAYGLLLLNNFNDVFNARQHFEIAIKINQNNYRAHYYTALALEKNNTDPIGAQIKYQRAIELQPNIAILHGHLGIAQLNDRKLNWQAAKQCFEKALELDSNDTISSFNLGSIYLFDLQDYEKASQCYEKAIELGLKEFGVYQNLANIYQYYLNNIEKAMLLYKQMIEIFDSNPYQYYKLGTINYDRCIYNEANNCLLKAAELTKVRAIAEETKLLPAIYCNLALTLEIGFENFEAAKGYLQDAINENPKFGEAYEYMATLLNNRFANYLQAKLFAEQAVFLLPQSRTAFYNYGTILHNLSEDQPALSAIEKAIQLDSKYVEAYVKMGFIYERLLNYDEAVKFFNQAIQIDSYNIDSHYKLAYLYLVSFEDFNLALKHFKILLEIDSNSNRYITQVARTYYLLGQSTAEINKEETMYYIDNAIRYDFEHYETSYAWIAQQCYDRGSYRNAIFYLEKALEYRMDDEDIYADMHELLGIWLSEHLSKNKEAKEYFYKSIAIAPHAYTINNLGMICEKLFEFNKAKKCYKIAIRMNPPDENAHSNLSNLLATHFSV